MVGWSELDSQVELLYYNITLRDVFKPKPGPVEGSLDFLGKIKPLEEVSDECRIPMEKSEADILMLAGEDDHNFESAEWAEAARSDDTKEAVVLFCYMVNFL